MLSVIMVNIVILIVILLSVIRLIVSAPILYLHFLIQVFLLGKKKFFKSH
jgi:hypothetical protein